MVKKISSTIKYLFTHPLTRTQRIKTLLKFIRWQIGVRLIKEKVIIPWVDDAQLIIGVGESGSTGNLYAGLADYEDMLFILHALHPTDIFIDIGANCGVYTILASKVVKAKSIAFEPVLESFQRLINQIQINRITGLVSPINKGVGDKKTKLFFTNNLDAMNKVSTISKASNTMEVEVIALDDELDKDKNYFIKIDVEGFEYNVISGANKILSSTNVMALIIELNGSSNYFGYSNEVIHDKIISLNFTPVSYDPIKRSLTVLDSYNKNLKNTIYVKNINLINSRCVSATKRLIRTANDFYI
jgi:FkbM family methyltransferase